MSCGQSFKTIPFETRGSGKESKTYKKKKKSVWLMIRCQLSCSTWRTTESRELLSPVSKVTSARQESPRSLAIVPRLLIRLPLLPSSTSIPHAPSFGILKRSDEDLRRPGETSVLTRVQSLSSGALSRDAYIPKRVQVLDP